MQTIHIDVKDMYVSNVLTMLKGMKNVMIDKINIDTPNNERDPQDNNAFGILNGKIKDPVAWQNSVREENERDVYSDILK